MQLQFDHGAQYISQPKTPDFDNAINEWMAAGVVQDWKGTFAVASKDGTISKEEDKKPHYVGYPTMNKICQHLLDHENIQVVLQTRAVS
ncbi:MAG: hypothetical protein HC797_08060, partial [Anaerolineales bacterium]|nr:hypothetical protein [Anaerolineales bacterium]